MKKILVGVVALLSALTAQSAFGQGSFVPAQTALKSVNGVMTPIGSATITVCPSNAAGLPCTPANVSIYSDAALTQPKTNPFTSDAFGNYQFAVASGTYTITVTAAGFAGYSYQVSTPSGGSSSATWASLPGGTNTTQSFNCGTGCSIGTLGSGTISATSVPFSGVAGGTNTTGSFNCGTGCSFAASGSGAIIATSMPFSGNSAAGNVNALTMDQAGSFSPVSNTAAQVAANQIRTPFGLSAPTITTTLTGGNILPADSLQFAYTLNTALGESLPSITASGAANTFSAGACASGSACTASIAPTVPSGYTGFTAYFCDNNGSGCGTTLQRVAGCVNVTGTCTVTARAIASGINLPIANTAIIQPPNLQAGNCPTGMLPSVFMQTSDGNWWPQAGVDPQAYSGTPQTPDGTFTFCRRMFFNDTQGAQTFKNAGVSFAHLAGTGTNAAVQDRTLGVDLATPANDSAARWALEVIQAQLDNNCNGCSTTGSPDGERTVFSGQFSDVAATNYTSGTYGPSVARLQFFKSGAGQNSGNIYRVINGIFTMNNAAAVTNGTEAQIYEASCSNGAGGTYNLDCVGLNLDLPGVRFTNGTGAIQISNTGAAVGGANPNTQDFVIKNYKHGLISLLNGSLGLTEISNTDPQALPMDASLNVTGSITTTPIATNWTTGYSNPTCSGGASTYTYQFVAVDNNGGTVPSVTSNTSGTCTNPLTSGNPATLSAGATLAATLAYRQAIRIDVYRTGGPMATGKIGSLTCNNNIPILGCSTFTDTGLAASGAVPTANTFGTMFAGGIQHSSANTVQAAADFTSAANTSLQTITGLSWNLDSSAHNYSFHCSLYYSQATAAVAMQFGIQAATNAPTQINAKGRVDTSTSAVTSGVLNALTTTTATSIVTFTPSATATVFGADLDGTIENPANTNGNAINIMVQTSNASDLPTVKRGSYCTLY